MRIMTDAEKMKPGSGYEWLQNREIIDSDPKTIAMMVEHPDAFIKDKLAPAILNSPLVQKSLALKDEEFLDVLESVEELTDPDHPEYLAAIHGTTIERERKLAEEKEKEDNRISRLVDWTSTFLDFMNGQAVLIFVLLVVAFAIAVLVVQFAIGSDPALDSINLAITTFFTVELVSKMAAHFHVRGEVDSFLLDILNFIDFAVVIIDLLFLYVESRDGESGGRNGGAVKGLRLVRGARLLRLLKIRRLLAKKKEVIKKEDAMNDPRAINWKDVPQAKSVGSIC